MDLARLAKKEMGRMTVQGPKSYEYTVTYGPLGKTTERTRSSKREIGHLAVAILLVVGVGLSYTGLPGFMSGGHAVDYTMLIGFVALFSASFFIHEMAHKLVAQKEGYWAEFRLTLVGAALTLLSIMPIFFKIISPGAVMISGAANKQHIGRISIAGPATNIALSTIFLGVSILVPGYSSIMLLGAAFNSWIALFNLIPYGIFDGLKIFAWSKRIWVLAFGASLALTVASYMLTS